MTAADVAAAVRSLPRTRALLFLADRTVVDGQAVGGGRPDGAPIFAPFVQGVILESCPRYLSALEPLENMAPDWSAPETFDDFVARVGAPRPAPS